MGNISNPLETRQFVFATSPAPRVFQVATRDPHAGRCRHVGTTASCTDGEKDLCFPSDANVWAPANDQGRQWLAFLFCKKWLAVASQWLGVARGGLLWLFFLAVSGSALFLLRCLSQNIQNSRAGGSEAISYTSFSFYTADFAATGILLFRTAHDLRFHSQLTDLLSELVLLQRGTTATTATATTATTIEEVAPP